MRVDFGTAFIGDTLAAISERTVQDKYSIATLLRAVSYIDPGTTGRAKPANFPVPSLLGHVQITQNAVYIASPKGYGCVEVYPLWQFQ